MALARLSQLEFQPLRHLSQQLDILLVHTHPLDLPLASDLSSSCPQMAHENHRKTIKKHLFQAMFSPFRSRFAPEIDPTLGIHTVDPVVDRLAHFRRHPGR